MSLGCHQAASRLCHAHSRNSRCCGSIVSASRRADAEERRVEEVDIVEQAARRDEPEVAVDRLVVLVGERDALNAVTEVDPELVEILGLQEIARPCR